MSTACSTELNIWSASEETCFDCRAGGKRIEAVVCNMPSSYASIPGGSLRVEMSVASQEKLPHCEPAVFAVFFVVVRDPRARPASSASSPFSSTSKQSQPRRGARLRSQWISAHAVEHDAVTPVRKKVCFACGQRSHRAAQLRRIELARDRDHVTVDYASETATK